MATTPAVPSTAPLKDELVTQQVLYMHQYTTWRLALAFTGMSDPTAIWQQMIMDTPFSVSFYRELEEKDEDVHSAMEQMKLAVLHRSFKVLPADDTGLAVDIAGFVQSQFDALPSFDLMLDNLLDAPFYGFSLVELMYDVSAGQVSLIDAKDCPQELFTFALPFYPQIGNLRLLQTPYDINGVEVPEQKFAIYSYRPRSRNRRGRPLLRKVFWPSWFKRQALRMWLRFAEKGPGTAVVKYPQGSGESEQRNALEAAEALIERTAVAVPENFGLMEELLKIARSQDPAVYKDLTSRCELSIYRTILGETLTSHGGEDGKGTQALGQVHETVKDEKAVSLARNVERVLNDQIIRNLVLWNYGPNAPMPKATLDKADEDDLTQRVNVDKTVQSMGYPITQDYIQETYGIPLPAEGDVVLKPAAPSLFGLPGESGSTTDDGSPKPTPDEGEKEKESAAFSDQPKTGQRKLRADLGDFDRVFEQLSEESRAIYRTRIGDLAEGMRRANIQQG